MPSPPRRWLPNVLTVLFLVLIAANYFGVFADLDWSWQVRTGGLIVEMGTPRTPDTFSYTIHGTHPPDFEWLYEVILWGTWSTFGMGGLKFLRILLVGAPLLIVGLRLRREGVRWHGIALALFTAIFVLAPAWNLRPLYCTTIGLLLAAWMLHDHCTGRRQLSWWLVVVMLLWANMHPGVITGQGLIFGAIAWEWLNQRLQWNTPLTRPALMRLTAVGGLALLATFVSPDPWERLRYPFKPELAHPIMRIFTEMQPTLTFIAKPPFAIGLAYLVFALVLLTVVLRFRQYRMWELALLAGTALLGNVAFRSLQDWLLVMLSLAVPHLAALLAQAARSDRRRAWLAALLRLDRKMKALFFRPLLRFQPGWLAGAYGVLLAVSLLPPLARSMPLQDSPEWPVAALDFIEEQGLQGRFFAPPDYGAYLGWRRGDKALIYTDTRGFFFPPLLLEDSMYIPEMSHDWHGRLRRVLDQYGTDYFLLETEHARGALWHALRPHIARPLYVDAHTVLLGANQVREAIAHLQAESHAAMK